MEAKHIIHLKLHSFVVSRLPHLSYSFSPLLSKTFQKRRVSSAEAVQMVVLSGAIAMWRTLWEWPRRSATLEQVGYFQRLS